MSFQEPHELSNDMSQDTLSDKKRGWFLTLEGLNVLLKALDPDPEQAIAQLEVLRLKLLRFFSERQCHTSEEQADIVLDRLTQKLMKGVVIEHIGKFTFGIAKFVHQEYLTELQHPQVSTESLLPGDELTLLSRLEYARSEETAEAQEQLLQFLDHCLQELNDSDRQLILDYYQGEKSKDQRRVLAEQHGINPGTLATRTCRIRAKLQVCMEHCLKEREKPR